MKKLALFTLIVVLFTACGKEDALEKYGDVQDNIYTCSQDQGPMDSTQIHQALLGTYKWVYVQYFGWGGPYESITDYADWDLTFNPDGTYELRQSDTAQIQGTWSIEPSWATYDLNMNPPTTVTYGELYFCQSYLSIVSSPVDGPDHLFIRQ